MRNIFFILLFGWSWLTAQPELLSHIGQQVAPQLSDEICDIPVYQGSMDQSGFQEDDLVPDFTLYMLNGDSLRLSDVLKEGKPVLLVGANYTCPVWRDKIEVLNAITDFYKDQIRVFVVYTVEAHPANDLSPYSGQIWTTSTNETDGILYPQPKTYGERLSIVTDMVSKIDIAPPILIDGPCNEWWSHFGPAPNNAYLVRPDGIVAAKHGWFHRAPENMWCDIDKLLGADSGMCTTYGSNGTFSFTLDDGDSLAVGQPGDILAVHCTLQNLSSTENVNILVKKAKVQTPKSWLTALCADICYATDIEETEIVIPPAESQPFIFYFYTDMVPDSGFARVQFINTTNQQNRIGQRFFGMTQTTSALDPLLVAGPVIYPNPVQGHLTVQWPGLPAKHRWSITDMNGRLYLEGVVSEETEVIDTFGLFSGPFVWICISPEGKVVYRELLMKL